VLLTDYTIAVLEDSIRILEILEKSRDGVTLAQITDQSGFVKNKAFRILFTLEKHLLVERDMSGRYRLGWRFLIFGHHAQNQTRLVDVSRQVMDNVLDATLESIFLGIISGDDVLCISARESPRSIRLFAQVGRRAPLHSGGVPKVLFAFLPDDQRRTLIEQFTGDPNSGYLHRRSVLEGQLEQIRAQGYAVIFDELDKDACSVAAPIRNEHGHVVAAISVAGPSMRFTDERISRYIEIIVDAGRHISEALGYEQPVVSTYGVYPDSQ
jgi:IclR family transcriptional regulator, KDG regulon repressor